MRSVLIPFTVAMKTMFVRPFRRGRLLPSMTFLPFRRKTLKVLKPERGIRLTARLSLKRVLLLIQLFLLRVTKP